MILTKEKIREFRKRGIRFTDADGKPIKVAKLNKELEEKAPEQKPIIVQASPDSAITVELLKKIKQNEKVAHWRFKIDRNDRGFITEIEAIAI